MSREQRAKRGRGLVSYYVGANALIFCVESDGSASVESVTLNERGEYVSEVHHFSDEIDARAAYIARKRALLIA